MLGGGRRGRCGSVGIVVVEPGRERLEAGCVGEVDAGVGPFVGEGAVEAFDFPVGLRAIGAGAFVGDGIVGEGGGEDAGAVARAVVGEDPFDGDPV